MEKEGCADYIKVFQTVTNRDLKVLYVTRVRRSREEKEVEQLMPQVFTSAFFRAGLLLPFKY
jgi:hypothetical protein